MLEETAYCWVSWIHSEPKLRFEVGPWEGIRGSKIWTKMGVEPFLWSADTQRKQLKDKENVHMQLPRAEVHDWSRTLTFRWGLRSRPKQTVQHHLRPLWGRNAALQIHKFINKSTCGWLLILPLSQSSEGFGISQVLAGTCHLLNPLGFSSAIRTNSYMVKHRAVQAKRRKRNKLYQLQCPGRLCPHRFQCGEAARAPAPDGERWKGRFSADWPVADDSISVTDK